MTTNGTCPRCHLLITSSYRPYGWRILGLMLAPGAAGVVLAMIISRAL